MKDQWIATEDYKPEFDIAVIVYCRIYGRYMAVYQRILDTNWGEWRDFNDKTVLPPTHWMPLPEPPQP